MLNYKRFFICLLYTLLTHGQAAEADEYSSGADYLQNAIRDIVIKNSEQSIFNLIDNQARLATAPPARRPTPASSLGFDANRRFSGGDHHLPHPPPDSYHPEYLSPPDLDSHHDYHPDPHPPAPSGHGGIPSPPSLTKGELAALYEAAVSAGHGIQFNSPTGLQDSLPGQAAVHEVHDTSLQHQHPHGDAAEGYYYYYYPLKSFMDGGLAHVSKHKVPKDHYQPSVLTSYNTHLHNVKVEPIHTVAPTKGKGLEPLFMAISSFVGMAVMFAFSMVLWPRFSGGLKGAIKTGKGGKGKIVPGKGGGKNNIKKKPRLLQDLNVNWSSLIRSWMDAYACKTCKNYRRLEPYRSALSRTERTRSKK